MRENIWMRKKEDTDLGHGLQQTFVGYFHSLHPEKANRDDYEYKIHAAINNILKEDGECDDKRKNSGLTWQRRKIQSDKGISSFQSQFRGEM